MWGMRMIEAKYSVLLCNKQIEEYISFIDSWLISGIKVIWFGTDEDFKLLDSKYKDYMDAFLLQAYVVLEDDCNGIIIDGNDTNALLPIIGKKCPKFNSAQYAVEHCNSGAHIIVQASAGTGKTKVMVDRILYLLHTDSSLHLPEMFMITFTNEAANQMSQRLQDALMIRYRLTKQKKYLEWLEEQSQMHISTIHSFAYFMLKKYGINESFTKELTLRGFEYEKKNIIKDAIDSYMDPNKNITNQLGVPFYRANSMINDFWHKFSMLGVSHKDMIEMDWGDGIDGNSYGFHNIIRELLPQLDEAYFEVKRKEDGISVDDIMRDLQEVLMSDKLPKVDMSMKYLFIDEFQDSDLSQINVACMLVKILNATLFVVGDIKQSIYKFRGATEHAFTLLRNTMNARRIKPALEFSLINNYRTAAGVLDRLDEYFRTWAAEGVLVYDKPVIPFNTRDGYIGMIKAKGRYDKGKKEIEDAYAQQIVDIVTKERDRLIEKVESSGKEPNEKNRVVILTRSNNELTEVSRLLKSHKIPATVQRDGSFYASEAVRDFYMLVCSFMFCDEPKHVFNYLMTPYAGEIAPLNINTMEQLSGNQENLIAYIDHFLDMTTWKEYHKALRLKPVMSVFKEIFDKEPILDNFIQLTKYKAKLDGYEEADIDAVVFTRARQYQANLEKLMELLQNNLGGDKVSIYDVYNFLKIKIATDRDESAAKVDSREDYTSVLCMTVHKSKGLEFDTVIIPFTNESFGGWEQTELLVNSVERKIGWNYTGDKEKMRKRYKYQPMSSSYYEELKANDIENGEKEGVRVLYVGLTRAIDRLICLVESSKNDMSWAKLIEEVGVDYE